LKNFVGSILGVLVGSYVLVVTVPIAQPSYPALYDSMWILLAGCQALQSTIQQFGALENILWFIITWLVIGVIASPFSDSKWNAVRTSVWVGILITLFSLASLLLINPEFWYSETRNWELLLQLIVSILTSFISLLSSIPSVMLIIKIKEGSEAPLPQKIETICECGAVFKSRPMICSECGKKLYDYEPD
jgi:hypothetical protein